MYGSVRGVRGNPHSYRDRSRNAAVSEARAIISFLGTRKLGETQTEIQRHLNISRIGVRNCIIRSEKMTCAVKFYPALGFLHLKKFFLTA